MLIKNSTCFFALTAHVWSARDPHLTCQSFGGGTWGGYSSSRGGNCHICHSSPPLDVFFFLLHFRFLFNAQYLPIFMTCLDKSDKSTFGKSQTWWWQWCHQRCCTGSSSTQRSQKPWAWGTSPGWTCWWRQCYRSPRRLSAPQAWRRR